jgi:hypothetical protein
MPIEIQESTSSTGLVKLWTSDYEIYQNYTFILESVNKSDHRRIGEKFLKFFNQYDSGLTQKAYTGSVAGVSGEGGQEAKKEYFMDDYGQPNVPILKEVYGSPNTARKAFNNVLKSLNSSEGQAVKEKLTVKEKKGREQLKERLQK